LLPWISFGGAIAGYIAAVGLTGWATFGIMVTKTSLPSLSFSVFECSNASIFGNSTFVENSTSSIEFSTLLRNITMANTEAAFPLYTFSPLWYCCWSSGIIIVIGLLWGFIFGCQNPEDIDPRLLFPFMRKLLFKLPQNVRHFIGYQMDEKQYFKKWNYYKEDKEMECLTIKDVINLSSTSKLSEEQEKAKD